MCVGDDEENTVKYCMYISILCIYYIMVNTEHFFKSLQTVKMMAKLAKKNEKTLFKMLRTLYYYRHLLLLLDDEMKGALECCGDDKFIPCKSYILCMHNVFTGYMVVVWLLFVTLFFCCFCSLLFIFIVNRYILCMYFWSDEFPLCVVFLL